MSFSHLQTDEIKKQEGETSRVWQEDTRVRHRVEVQALQIERFLARHDIKAEVDGGAIRTNWIDFDLRSQLSEGWQRLSKMTNGLVSALGVPEVKMSRHDGNLRLMVRREAAHPVDLLDLLAAAPNLSSGEVILGIDEEGRPVILDLFTNEMSHILVSGLEGAGKSGLLRSVAVSLAITSRQSDIQLCIISAGSNKTGLFSRSNQLLPLNYLPHLQFPVTQNMEEAEEALSFLADELLYREEGSLDTPKLVVLIDDADLLITRGGQRIIQPLIELLEAPDDTGLRLILSAANPNQAPLAQLMRYSAQLRLIGWVSDADQAFLLTGEDSTGAENLNGRGDFLAVSFDKIMRFQSAYIDDYDLHLTLSELHRRSRNILIAKQRAYSDNVYTSSQEDAPQVFTMDNEKGRISFTNEPTTRSNVIQGQIVKPEVSEDPSLLLKDKEKPLTYQKDDSPTLDHYSDIGPLASVNIVDDIHQDAESNPNRPSLVNAKNSVRSPARQTGSKATRLSHDDDLSVNSLPMELEYSDIDDENWDSSAETEDRSDDNNRYH